MKLSQLRPKTQDLEIKLPDGSPTGIVLKVVGQDSKQVREVAKRFATIIDDSKPFAERMKLITDRANEIVSACVVGWAGLENDDGTPMAYSPEKAVEIFSDPEFTFISEQVMAYANERQNFFRREDTPA